MYWSRSNVSMLILPFTYLEIVQLPPTYEEIMQMNLWGVSKESPWWSLLRYLYFWPSPEATRATRQPTFNYALTLWLRFKTFIMLIALLWSREDQRRIILELRKYPPYSLIFTLRIRLHAVDFLVSAYLGLKTTIEWGHRPADINTPQPAALNNYPTEKKKKKTQA